MSSKRIVIAGLGEIGKTLARKLTQGLPGLVLSAIATRDRAKAQAWLEREGISCPLIALDEMPDHADLAVECAPAAILDQICRPMLNAGKQVMVLSASALLPRPDLIELAREKGGRIIVPTGALIGFDAVSAAAEGTIHSVRMITRKPPNGLAGAPYLVENGISVEGLTSALRVFNGSARRRRGVSRQCQRRCGVVAGRHRSRSHHDPNLGRPGGDAQLSSDQGRLRLGEFRDVDREHPVGEPENRPYHRALGDCGAAQARGIAAGGDLTG